MTRPSTPFPVLLLTALAACGGGAGGGPVDEPPQQPIFVDLGTQTAPGGAVVLFAASQPAFAPNGVFVGQWRANGLPLMSSRVVAVGPSQLATVVPTGMASGQYDVEVLFTGGRGLAKATVTATPWSTDPEGDVLAFSAQLATRIATLRQQAQTLRDPAYAAALTADLDRLEDMRLAWQQMVPLASLADRNVLATVRNATPWLVAAGVPTVDGDSVPVDPDAVRQQLAANVLAWRRGMAAITLGNRLGSDFGFGPVGLLLQPAMAIAGGVQMVQAMSGVLSTYDRFYAVDVAAGLRVVASPTAGSGLAGAPLAWLVEGSSRAVGAEVSLLGVAADDRTLPDPGIQQLFAVVDAALQLQASLPAEVPAFVQTPFPPPPAEPSHGVGVLSGAELTIVAQDNPGLDVVLNSGRLRLASTSIGLPAATTVTIRADAGAFGVVTQTLLIDVLAMRGGMLPIEPGTYQRGSGGQIQDLPWTVVETPVGPVTLARMFWVGRCEVTQAEFAAVTGLQPSFFVGDQRPVENVTWPQAVAFCEALTASEAAAGRLPPGYVYRLPTEAEWEYCTRAGNQAEWSFGFPPTCLVANFAPFDAPCVNPASTIEVASYAPNAWGLHDTAGNVLEWCADAWSGTSGYPAGAATDPFVAFGPLRVVRGGSFQSSSIALRSAHRAGAAPGEPLPTIGFRVVCAPAL